jgi:hypothetical protein
MDFPKTDVGGALGLACKEGEGLPEANRRGNRMRSQTWPQKVTANLQKVTEKQRTL